MKVEITGNNIDITPGIRERIEGKFKKLEAKRNLDIIGRHASVTKRANGKHKVEAYATIAGGKVVASAEQEDLFGAIREMYQKLERQLDKLQHKGEARRATHAHAQAPGVEEPEVELEEE
ncbi:ribosome hibernation-promoting factor, HPF/YfiA family [Aliivibrio fischeri]|uniref:ribosome hibernation-promoting factor, HPF/YfiA family n=1 Tax=Aliivibrio fischeri TaxID=668 RepID=UPI0012DAF07D|nr:ribosome-associated translation inhibitor RaiA [Aliivibrio fischeri]MUL11588.1 ribosome-associated translation inhibitor RaiA [Aliivibrio fischeri]MUL13412.1 ribosome-associated translation inhibitor RaiA [Aliivibrio fischeri]